MLLNAQKCKCIHYGFNNKKYDYFIGNVCIETTCEERDLGVIITETPLGKKKLYIFYRIFYRIFAYSFL